MIDSGVKCKVLFLFAWCIHMMCFVQQQQLFCQSSSVIIIMSVSSTVDYSIIIFLPFQFSHYKTEEEGRGKKRKEEKKRETDLKNTGSCFSRCLHFSFSVYLLLAVSSINHNIIIFYDRVVYIALIHNFLPIHMNIWYCVSSLIAFSLLDYIWTFIDIHWFLIEVHVHEHVHVV